MLQSAVVQGRTVQGALFDQLSAQNTLHRSPPKDPRFLDGFVLRAGNVLRTRRGGCLGPGGRLDATSLCFRAVGQALIQALTTIGTARRRALLERGNGTMRFNRLRGQGRPRGGCAGPRVAGCRGAAACRRGHGLRCGPARRRCDVPTGAGVLLGVGWVSVSPCSCLGNLCCSWLVVRGVLCWDSGFLCGLGLLAHIGFRAHNPSARRLLNCPGPRVV